MAPGVQSSGLPPRAAVADLVDFVGSAYTAAAVENRNHELV